MSGPKTFRKKPVVIEAVQFTGENVEEIQSFTVDSELEPPIFRVVVEFQRAGYPTEEGVTAAVYDKLHLTWVGVKDGQWIIPGVQGEFYPLDPDIFDATYEEADA